MEIKVVFNENFKRATTPEEYIKSLEPMIKEYLDYKKFGYYKDLKVALAEDNKDMSIVEKMTGFTPSYFLHIIPGKETDWIDNKTIHELMSDFRIVVIDTMQLETKYVNKIKQVIFDDVPRDFEDCGNPHDNSHVIVCQ